MISHAYEFMCDNCGHEAYYIYPNKKEAKNEARHDGWTIYKNYCFCSEECFVNLFRERMATLCVQTESINSI